MPTRDGVFVAENDWKIASIIVWGMPKSLEIWAKLADTGLAGFARGSVTL